MSARSRGHCLTRARCGDYQAPANAGRTSLGPPLGMIHSLRVVLELGSVLVRRIAPVVSLNLETAVGLVDRLALRACWRERHRSRLCHYRPNYSAGAIFQRDWLPLLVRYAGRKVPEADILIVIHGSLPGATLTETGARLGRASGRRSARVTAAAGTLGYVNW